ncbi:MAG TPA: hypothetical protein VK698_15510 [Kofleriaceae bacterium]|nr:hypothetical protein [Kofleriaceae bacterium]
MTCNRLEREDMLAYLGEEMDPHVDACADCRARRAEYVKIAAALAAESERPLPADWMKQTEARLRARWVTPPSSPAVPVVSVVPVPRRRRVAMCAGIAAATAVAAAAILIARPGAADPPTLAMRVRQGRDHYRGSGQKGDVLEITATSGDADRFELRIYRDDDLVLRCPGGPAPACRPGDDGVRVAHVFASPGRYDVIWLTADSEIAAPVGGRDADVRAALEGGAHLETGESTDVH